MTTLIQALSNNLETLFDLNNDTLEVAIKNVLLANNEAIFAALDFDAAQVGLDETQAPKLAAAGPAIVEAATLFATVVDVTNPEQVAAVSDLFSRLFVAPTSATANTGLALFQKAIAMAAAILATGDAEETTEEVPTPDPVNDPSFNLSRIPVGAVRIG